MIEQGTTVAQALSDGRTLSDADVQAIAAALEARLTDRVVKGAGTGVLTLAKRLLFWAIISLFVYAIAHGWKP